MSCQLEQYTSYQALPTASHLIPDSGYAKVVLPGALGVYKWVEAVNGWPLGIWVPADMAERITQYASNGYGVSSATRVGGGGGYEVGEWLTPSGGVSDTDALIIVDAIDGGGGITAATLLLGGLYLSGSDPSPLSANPVVYRTGNPGSGLGSGATFDITMGEGNPFVQPVRISIRIGGDTFDSLDNRGWNLFPRNGANTPTVNGEYLEMDSGPWTGVANKTSETAFPNFDPGSLAPKAFFLYLECDVPNGLANALFHMKGLEPSAPHLYSKWSPTPGISAFKANQTFTDDLQIVGRGSLFTGFTPYEPVFGFYNYSTDTTKGGFCQMWPSEYGRTEGNFSDVLTKEMGVRTFNQNQVRVFAQAGSFVSPLPAIFRVRELHLFRLQL